MSGFSTTAAKTAISPAPAPPAPIPAAGTTTTILNPAAIANPLGKTQVATYDGVNRTPQLSYGTIYQLADIRGQQARPNLTPIGLPDRRNVWEANRA